MQPRRFAQLVSFVLLLTSCSRDVPDRQNTTAMGVAQGSSPVAYPTDSLMKAGEQVYFRGEFDSARALWRQALTVAPPGDSLTEPRVLTFLGLAAYRQGDYPAARRLGEQALSLKLRHRLRAEIPKSYNALGLLAWNEGRLPEAGDLFRSTIDLAGQEGDKELAAKAGNNLGLLQTELGAFDEARGNFQAARDAGRVLGDARMEGGALNNLGMLDVWLGNASSAVRSLLEAQRLYRSVSYETGEENVYGQLGTAYAELGQPQRAFAALDSALAIARRQGLRSQEASDLETIADFYRTFGDDQRALETYGKARAINAELDLKVELANNLRNEASIRAGAGLLVAASSDAEKARAVHRSAGARFEELHDLLLLAEISDRQGHREGTREHLRDAVRLARHLRAPIARGQVALTRARIAHRAENPRLVLQILDSAKADLEATLSGSRWEVEALKSSANGSLGALDSAAAAGHRAVAAVERMRGGMGGGSLSSTYAAARASVYVDLVLVLLRQGRDQEAFEVADAARARALLEHLPSVRSRIDREGSAGNLAEREALLRRIDVLVERLGEVHETPPEERGPEAPAMANELGRHLRETRSEYESLVTRLEAGSPGAAMLLGGGSTSAAAAGSALRAGEVLLEYLVTPERVLIFVLTPKTLRVLESSASEADLVGRVRLARDLFGQRHLASEESRQVSEALHRVLVTPVIESGALAGAGSVLIVPHGALSYLPFAALQNPATGRALVDDFSVWSLPSASALPTLRQSPTTSIHDRSGRRGTVFAPFPDRLPATDVEAASFRRSFVGGSARLGTKASEDELRKSLSRGDVVHVGSHGVLNPVNPLFSYIEVAGRTGRPDDDGRLEVHELLDLTIRSPLVFLSGCETGLGLAGSTDFARREDYTTLAQSFLYAGAGNVLATLWRIEDAGAAAFAGHFYRHLRRMSPREALAAAQREMRKEPRYSAPYYWAAYTLSGEGS